MQSQDSLENLCDIWQIDVLLVQFVEIFSHEDENDTEINEACEEVELIQSQDESKIMMPSAASKKRKLSAQATENRR
jgi:hypothetical protein